MTPSCYLLKTDLSGSVLYFGEVCTSDCLSLFAPSEPVHLIELGAELDGSWVSATEVPDSLTVKQWQARLADPKLSLVNFTARVGLVELSTHDDGEATFKVSDQQQALSLLTQAVGEPLASQVAPSLLGNPDCYIALRNGLPVVFASFQAYLAGA